MGVSSLSLSNTGRRATLWLVLANVLKYTREIAPSVLQTFTLNCIGISNIIGPMWEKMIAPFRQTGVSIF